MHIDLSIGSSLNQSSLNQDALHKSFVSGYGFSDPTILVTQRPLQGLGALRYA